MHYTMEPSHRTDPHILLFTEDGEQAFGIAHGGAFS